jgi:hypothetical protein
MSQTLLIATLRSREQEWLTMQIWQSTKNSLYLFVVTHGLSLTEILFGRAIAINGPRKDAKAAV